MRPNTLIPYIFILPSTCTWHVCCRWYTTDTNIITIGIQIFVPKWHRRLYPGVADIGVRSIQEAVCFKSGSPANRLPAKPFLRDSNRWR